MIDGNKKIFERLWKLSCKINSYLDRNEVLEITKSSPEMLKLRNSQLSMVNILTFLKYYQTRNI